MKKTHGANSHFLMYPAYSLENTLIELQPFNESEFSDLLAEIPDERFLLQWAGPKYRYPLDVEQIQTTLKNTIGVKPTAQVFKVVKTDIQKTIGHIQIMDIDYNAESCVLGRVLIYSKYRRRG